LGERPADDKYVAERVALGDNVALFDAAPLQPLSDVSVGDRVMQSAL